MKHPANSKQEEPMANVTINGKDYNPETLSNEAKEKLMMAQFCDRKIVDLKADLIIAQIARNSVVDQLQALANVETNGKARTVAKEASPFKTGPAARRVTTRKAATQKK
jgi:hypothetical protein